MKESLIEFLLCPKCRKKLTLTESVSKKLEVIEGTLICSNRHKFRIENGIPRLLVDKSKGFQKTEDAFSAKWKKYNSYFHKKNWIELQKNWFLDRFGWRTINNFNKFLRTRTKILDAGTGLGNSAKLLSANTKAQVFAIDASQSIEFAYKKYGNSPNIHFIQTDIRKLPFKKDFFDFILSDQVLHHTKDTKTSFEYLTKFLSKKGKISIYVYNKKAPIREFADDFIRSTTIHMSEQECIEFSKDMANLGKALRNIKKKITIPRDISLLKIKKGTYDVQRFVYWHFLKCFWADDDNFDRSVGVNFDWYYPKFAYRHTPEEVKKWFKNSKIKMDYFNEVESGINATGTKI